jgi:hypothetical protein
VRVFECSSVSIFKYSSPSMRVRARVFEFECEYSSSSARRDTIWVRVLSAGLGNPDRQSPTGRIRLFSSGFWDLVILLEPSYAWRTCSPLDPSCCSRRLTFQVMIIPSNPAPSSKARLSNTNPDIQHLFYNECTCKTCSTHPFMAFKVAEGAYY